MSHKHWIYPKDDDLVLSALRGLAAANPALGIIPEEKVVFNPKAGKKVAVISGGGAGHEPLHLGFVGSNLLDAAVSGAIFASPLTRQIMGALKATANKEQGAVVVVKNYTGDVLHFGLVAERAQRDGYPIEVVSVSDDVAVGRTQNAMVGRRGLAGTAIVHKVVGGAAASGGKLAHVGALGRQVNSALVTMSAALDRTSVPGKAEETELTGAGQAELGLGIHNEPGEKLQIPPITDLVDVLYKRLLDENDKERHYLDFDKDDDYVLVVNNIGGTSSLELYAIAHYAVARCPLEKKPTRVYISDFVTSLSAPGFSLTLLNLKKAATDEYSLLDILNFLDAPTDAPGWKPKLYSGEQWAADRKETHNDKENVSLPQGNVKIDSGRFSKALKAAMNRVIEKEPLITKYDTQVGDGDCGETLESGAKGVLAALDSEELKPHLDDPVAVLSALTDVVEEHMGGTSGGIYAIFLTGFVKNLKEAQNAEIALVAKALHAALYDSLFKYTKARKGGRTLVDTLQPFVDVLVESGDLKKAVEAARAGCEETANLEAKFGRASYVDESEFAGGVPDPGAVGLLALIEGFAGEY